VAVAVKDLIDVSGMRGNGNPDLAKRSPGHRRCSVIARLRAAGADVFCRTALLEYAAGALHPDIPRQVIPSICDAPPAVPAADQRHWSVPGCAGWRWAPTPGDRSGCPRTTAESSASNQHTARSTAGVQPLAESLDHVGC
jgi:hypothetical protein